jgi:hypothetical protein
VSGQGGLSMIRKNGNRFSDKIMPSDYLSADVAAATRAAV